MRKLLGAFVFCGALVGLTSSATAATFNFQFCPSGGTECTEDGITSALLSFATVDGTADANDYILTATIVGGDVGTSTVDELEFSLSNLKFDGTDFTASLTGAPGGVAAWSAIVEDNVPGCNVGPSSGNDPCIQSINPEFGPATNNGAGLTWTFAINILGAELISPTTAMNFRFQLVDANGTSTGIFSPSGNYTFSTTSTTTTTGTQTDTTTGANVPEPAALFLLGMGLLVAGQRLRRRA